MKTSVQLNRTELEYIARALGAATCGDQQDFEAVFGIHASFDIANRVESKVQQMLNSLHTPTTTLKESDIVLP